VEVHFHHDFLSSLPVFSVVLFAQPQIGVNRISSRFRLMAVVLFFQKLDEIRRFKYMELEQSEHHKIECIFATTLIEYWNTTIVVFEVSVRRRIV
jgi:hypothetical protein